MIAGVEFYLSYIYPVLPPLPLFNNPTLRPRQAGCSQHGVAVRNALHCTVPHPMCAACAPFTDASRPCRQVYHSNLEDPNAEVVCGCAILPMKTTTKGPAPVIQEGAHTLHPHPRGSHATSLLGHSLAAPSAPGDDFIDEVLGFFKANVLFKSFQPAGSADRVLLYLTLYTTQALAKCVTCETAPVALKALTAMAHENFSIPGDSGFTLGTFYSPPGTSQEGDLCRAYFKQAREELGR